MVSTVRFVTVWTDDLMFFSRIGGVAKHFGSNVRMGKTLEACRTLISQESCAGLLVDLQVAGEDLEALVSSMPEIQKGVAFGSHVDAAGLRKARDLGLTPVMARSQFVERLPREWSNWFPDAVVPPTNVEQSPQPGLAQ